MAHFPPVPPLKDTIPEARDAFKTQQGKRKKMARLRAGFDAAGNTHALTEVTQPQPSPARLAVRPGLRAKKDGE